LAYLRAHQRRGSRRADPLPDPHPERLSSRRGRRERGGGRRFRGSLVQARGPAPRSSGGGARPSRRRNVLWWIGEKGAGQRCLLLEGHTDVVTEGDPHAWSSPPFAAEMRDGRIYGRGATAMKSGLAAAMIALAAFKRAGVTPKGKLLVGALADEEDAMIGVRHLV